MHVDCVSLSSDDELDTVVGGCVDDAAAYRDQVDVKVEPPARRPPSQLELQLIDLIKDNPQFVCERYERMRADDKECQAQLQQLASEKRELQYLMSIVEQVEQERNRIRDKIRLFGRPMDRWATVDAQAEWDDRAKEVIVPEPVQRVVSYYDGKVAADGDAIDDYLDQLRDLGLADR